MKLGAQLYTLREQMKTPEQIRCGLEKVAKIGYSCVQISGIGKTDAHELKKICDGLGLEIAVTHTHPDRILGDTHGVIAEHDIMGCRYIGLGAMPKCYHSFDKLSDFAQNFRRAVNEISEAGKIFTYHNHAFEFERRDGKTMLDELIDSFDPDKLKITLDCYWVSYAGADVCDTIDRLHGKIDCVHLKDHGIRDNNIVMLPIGEGNMNYPRILEHLEKAGTRYALVEQDNCNGEDPFECLERSYNYLKPYFTEE